MEWRLFLKEEANDFNATHHYLARIALEIRKSYSADPSKFKLEDFLLQFKTETKCIDQEPADKKAHIAASKAAWKAVCGIKK